MASILALLVCYAAGILNADQGGRLVPPFGIAVAAGSGVGAVLFVGALGARIRAGQRATATAPVRRGRVLEGRRFLAEGRGGGPCGFRPARLLLLVVVCVAAFAAGQARLARELSIARAGAQRVAVAEAAGPGGATRGVAEAAPVPATGSRTWHRVDARVRARRPLGGSEEVELVDVRGLRGGPPVPERMLLRFARSERGSRAERMLWPGARVRLALRILPLSPARNPGLPDLEQALARRGIGARAVLVKPDWVVQLGAPPGARGEAGAGWAALRTGLVQRIADRLDGSLAGAGLARSLALGDRRDLPEATRDAFRTLGLAHLVSVSGLHIGFVALPAGWLVERLRVRLRPRAWPVRSFFAPLFAAASAAAAYAWLTGASLPTQRACLLFVGFALLRALGARLSPGASLASVALLLLALDPACLFDLGAQLSFGACAALIAAGLWGRSGEALAGASGSTSSPAPARPPAPRFVALRDSTRASLAISLACLPLVEGAGLPRALAAPVVNLAAIPFTGFVVLPAALAAGAFAALTPRGFGEVVVGTLLAPAAGLERAATALVASGRGDGLAGESVGRLPRVLALVAIVLGVASIRRGRLVPAASVWLLVGGRGIAPAAVRFGPPTGPRVVFFDVGQADAALLTAEGAHWLIDSGPGDEAGRGGVALLRSLRALGVDRLEGLIVTHGDLDHRGGAARILSTLEVAELWIPALAAPDPALALLALGAERAGTRVRRVGAGDQRRSGASLSFEVLWPRRSGPEVGSAASARGRNASSIVLRVELAGQRVLFMGDVDREVEASLMRDRGTLRADVLKLGHHGSRSSSSSAFLAAVAPRLAIVSAPCHPTRGLPSAEVFDRLAGSEIRVGWTGREGAIALDGAGPHGLRMRHWARPRDCLSALALAPARAAQARR